MIAYLNGEFAPQDSLKISVNDRGFLFGDGVYEVVMAYNGKFFAMDGHRTRLERSLRQLAFPAVQLDIEEIGQELLRKNDLSDGCVGVYLQLTRGEAPRKHAFPTKSVPNVYAFAFEFERDLAALEHGVKVVTHSDMRWTRCDIKTTSLIGHVLGAQFAKASEAKETIFVRDGFVTEGSHTNLFVVKNDVIWTYPSSPYILTGVTRNEVLKLCRELGFSVVEQPVSLAEFLEADEAFITGTTTEVTPIVAVNGNNIWQVGSVTKAIQQQFYQAADPTFLIS